MWLARLAGTTTAAGVYVALRGWQRSWPAPASVFLWFLLAALLAGFAGTVVRRRSAGPSPLAAWLGWFARSGLVLGAVGLFLVLARGMPHDSAYARSDLARIADGQRAFQRDSGRVARSLDELGPRYQPHRAYVGSEALTMRFTPDGWTAEARPARTGQSCAIFEGSTAVAPATLPGIAACTVESRGAGFLGGWLLAAVGILAGAGSIAIARRITAT